MKKLLWLGVLCSFVLMGCGSYFKIIDPSTKNEYYTQEMKESKSGATKFIDAKTGSEVTLQNTEVKEISKDEFNKGIGKE